MHLSASAIYLTSYLVSVARSQRFSRCSQPENVSSRDTRRAALQQPIVVSGSVLADIGYSSDLERSYDTLALRG